jgi:hypothetical protein
MAESGIGLAKLQAAGKNNNKRMDQSYSPKDLLACCSNPNY